MMRRRALGALFIAGLLAVPACGSSSDPKTPSSTSRIPSETGPTVGSSTSTSDTTTTAAPPPKAYQPLAAEPEKELKQTAARIVETLGTFGPGGGSLDAAATRLGDAGFDPKLATRAPAVASGADSSVAEVIYPQLGGLTEDQASVMVVVQLTRTTAASTEQVSRTIDVRLRKAGSWAVIDIASEGGASPANAQPDRLATEVLASERLSMSDSARWDIAAGLIDPRLLQLLLDLSDQAPLSITVLASGHPVNVFGKTSVSNHTRGRAVDIWSVDGKPVIGADETSAGYNMATAALAAGVTELGSPWDLDGPGGASFANALHADHLHLAYDA